MVTDRQRLLGGTYEYSDGSAKATEEATDKSLDKKEVEEHGFFEEMGEHI